MEPTKMFIVVCFVVTITGAYDDDFPSDDYNLLPVPVGKRATNSFCRRCRFHRDEWASCGLCYGRPRGIVPYYGGKRSTLEDVLDDVETKVEDKRSFGRSSSSSGFLDSRCCDVFGVRECCRRSGGWVGKRGFRTVYFPVDFADNSRLGMEEWKREFDSSYVPVESVVDDGGLCSCCEGPVVDESCCSMECAERK